MAGLRIDIVTFTANEAAAINQLFSRLPGGAWRTDGSRIRNIGSRGVTLEHHALYAQGNVLAAAKLASLYADTRNTPSLVIFYGCAGSPDPTKVGQLYAIESTYYMSLGSVQYRRADPGQCEICDEPNPAICDKHGETVTLKNKWLAPVLGTDAPRLKPLEFARVDLVRDSLEKLGIRPATVLAGEKVIGVPADIEPTPISGEYSELAYEKEEWSYGQALAFLSALAVDKDILIDMESYGIAAVMQSFNMDGNVLILRVVTDHLTNHAKTEADQRTLLNQGVAAVTVLLLEVLANA